ncbi:MAG: Acetyl xylan esterase [Gemmatimonadetes bacterium]|nr:Acetyl xylan esterase [Gemmatimonadota bacterium]
MCSWPSPRVYAGARGFVRCPAVLAAFAAIFSSPSLCLGQWPVFVPIRASGTYAVGERAGWTATLPDSARIPAGGYRYVITKNRKDTVRTGVLDFSSGTARLEATISEPAMMYVQVHTGEKGPASTVNLGAAIGLTQIKPVVPRPADFDAFWDGKLKALAAVPINAALTPVPTKVPDIELYTVKLQSLGSMVQGYLAKPKRDGKFPALLIYQYAGVYPLQPQWATSRAVEGWLVLNVDSHDVYPDSIVGVPQNYRDVGNTDRETSYFLAMYLRDHRAVDYLASRPDWDGRVMVATGTSMGGQQSVVTAALDPRITAVVVNEPSGADVNAELHGRAAGYPNWQWSDANVMETARYFDTVNFAPRITAPVCIAVGFIDTTATPWGIITMFNQIRGPKELIPMIDSDHNHITPQKQSQWNARSKEVLDQLRTTGAFTPKPFVN